MLASRRTREMVGVWIAASGSITAVNVKVPMESSASSNTVLPAGEHTVGKNGRIGHGRSPSGTVCMEIDPKRATSTIYKVGDSSDGNFDCDWILGYDWQHPTQRLGVPGDAGSTPRIRRQSHNSRH